MTDIGEKHKTFACYLWRIWNCYTLVCV